MVDGGENIKEASWESVSSMLQVVSYFLGLRFHTSNAVTSLTVNTTLSPVSLNITGYKSTYILLFFSPVKVSMGLKIVLSCTNVFLSNIVYLISVLVIMRL